MIIWWVEELSYPFEDLHGTHAATCDRVVLVIIQMMSADKSEVMLADTPGQESMSLMILFAKRKVNGRSVK